MYGLEKTRVTLKQLGTLVTISYKFGGLFELYYACKPFNKGKAAMDVVIFALIVVCMTVPTLSNLFQYATLGREQLLLLLVEILSTPFIMFVFVRLFQAKPKKSERKS